MTTTLEGWPTKAKEARSPHEVRLALLGTNPVFQCLRDKLGLTPQYFNVLDSTASRLEPLRAGSLLFTTKFP